MIVLERTTSGPAKGLVVGTEYAYLDVLGFTVGINMRPLAALACVPTLAPFIGALALGALTISAPSFAAEDPAATSVASPYVRSDWMIIPSEDVIYKYYPKFAADRGVLGRVLLDCDVSQASGLSNCAVHEEKPEHYGFGEAAIQLAQKEIHLWSQVVSDTPLLGQVSVSVAFNPKTSAPDNAATSAAAAAMPTAVSNEVTDWSKTIKPLDWGYAAPAENQMTFWKADRRLGPDTVRGAVRYEYFLTQSKEGQSVRSSEVAYEFDCKADTFKTLSITTHTESNLGGAGVSKPINGAALKITPGSVLDDAETRICTFDAGK